VVAPSGKKSLKVDLGAKYGARISEQQLAETTASEIFAE